MKKAACKYSIIGFIFTVVLGSLLHFAFEFSGENTLVGAFTPVNESVWEHLKLLLFPSLIVSIFEYFAIGRYRRNFIPSRLYSILIGLITIVFLFYTYTGIIGRSITVIDILIFVIASAVVFASSCIFFKHENSLIDDNARMTSIIIITALIILFIYFTFDPPMLELFRDPITEDFGIILLFA